MNGRANDEMLAEECGLDYDEVTAVTADDNTLSAEDFLYECAQCEAHLPLSAFTDTEWDGDIWGICPKCGKHTMIFELTSDNDIPLTN